jgi:hypothetical protein
VKKLLLIIALILLCEPVFAEDNPIDFSNQLIDYEINKVQKEKDTVNWLKRAEIKLQLDSELNTQYQIRLVQPVVQTPNHITFVQSEFGTDVNNVGIGYRRFFSNNKEMIGFNMFNDYKQHNQVRSSLGVEYFFWRSEIRYNNYYGNTREIANNGYDYQIKTQLPYMPWFNVSIEGFKWEAEREYKVNANIQVYPKLTLEMGYKRYNNDPKDNYIKITYDAYGNKPHAMFKNNRPIIREYKYLNADVSEKKLDKVNRENNLKIYK